MNNHSIRIPFVFVKCIFATIVLRCDQTIGIKSFPYSLEYLLLLFVNRYLYAEILSFTNYCLLLKQKPYTAIH
jgi:hypothetical protein